MASAESDNDSDAAGDGHALHIPVLAGRAVEWLGVRDGGVYVDATFGAGGYTRAILAHRGARLIAIDRDRSAIARGAIIAAQAHGRLQLIEDRFSSLEAILADCGAGAIDGIVFDLGVSSMQLDEADRGFSFRFDGPLDMRMGGDGPSAADVVAHAGERDLASIIASAGEERHARASRAPSCERAGREPIETTRALAAIVARVVQRARAHPSGDAHVPGAADFRQPGTRRTGARTRSRPSACSRPADASPWSRSIRSRTASSRIFLTERSRAPAASRHQPEIAAAPVTFRAS